LFLERLTKEKGPEAAIRIARATGLELRMAAKVPWAQTRYNKDRLQPLVDGKQIKLSASSTTARKAICSGGASVPHFPIDWPGPFGPVMIRQWLVGLPSLLIGGGPSRK